VPATGRDRAGGHLGGWPADDPRAVRRPVPVAVLRATHPRGPVSLRRLLRSSHSIWPRKATALRPARPAFIPAVRFTRLLVPGRWSLPKLRGRKPRSRPAFRFSRFGRPKPAGRQTSIISGSGASEAAVSVGARSYPRRHQPSSGLSDHPWGRLARRLLDRGLLNRGVGRWRFLQRCLHVGRLLGGRLDRGLLDRRFFHRRPFRSRRDIRRRLAGIGSRLRRRVRKRLISGATGSSPESSAVVSGTAGSATPAAKSSATTASASGTASAAGAVCVGSGDSGGLGRRSIR
jgi:hypothetical protein